MNSFLKLTASVLFTTSILTACMAPPLNDQEQPKGFTLGKVVEPPVGCIEMRKTNPKADC